MKGMKGTVFVGTDNGLYVLGANPRHDLAGRPVRALAGDESSLWAVIEDALVFNSADSGDWRQVAEPPSGQLTCLLPTPEDLLVGSSGAHLFRRVGTTWEQVESFEKVERRDAWYTPWGGPPDTRSLSHDARGNIYVNVHVGGIPKSSDAGRTWRPTIDIHADAHQVLALPSPAGRVLAASARGLAISEDGGTTWRFHTRGLPQTYLRAVAVSDKTVFISASEGPRGRQAAIYRCRLDGDTGFERCRVGPEWFSSNIDTNCLGASHGTVAFGTTSGSVFISRDEGDTWEVAATDLAAVRCVLLT